jgi:hypothetical protein
MLQLHFLCLLDSTGVNFILCLILSKISDHLHDLCKLGVEWREVNFQWFVRNNIEYCISSYSPGICMQSEVND